ncbi:hypothetical protein E2C01_038689 [Portunus trituberculatus]|uniref:Uncharacterized protein n=1 Tax=Portunus trituberculatus TaxID=210409 RepID=A0A5B7FHU2_PORTR|nr:hypothetical protein [Portunus trituberculatus]
MWVVVRGAVHPRTDRLRVRAVLSGGDERQVYGGADPNLPALITLYPLPCTLHSPTYHLPPSTPLSPPNTVQAPFSPSIQHHRISLGSPPNPSPGHSIRYLLSAILQLSLLLLSIRCGLLPSLHPAVSPSVLPSNV